MRTIEVTASRPYRAEIGPRTLSLLGERTRTLFPKARRAAVVTDDTVAALHGDKALAGLKAAGLDTCLYTVPHGEASKNADTLIALLNWLTEKRMTRSDALVALGGGMIGDLTGFAAAVYMRGLGYIQCPTTLLAAVDSSVGGKTAVDLPAGKNLMGAFWQPSAVLCDMGVLDTLPDDIFTDGCAEVIKTAILFDPVLFRRLEHDGKAFDREAVIADCVAHKRDVVAEDEFDTGRRALLNLGHTLAHAVEACSDFGISHGRAVAIGAATVTRAAARRGLCPTRLAEDVCALLTRFGLPTVTDIPLDSLMGPMLSDKKSGGGVIKVIVPRELGSCEVIPMEPGALKDFMEAGLQP